MNLDDQKQDARALRAHPFDTFDHYWSKLVDGLAALGTLLIGVLMLIICADIVFRNLLGSSLPLISELGALTLVMIVYLQLATTIRADRLAKTEFFLPRLRLKSPMLGKVVAAVFNVLGAWLLGLIAWSTLRILEKDIAAGEFIGVPGIATLQTWPFRVMILLGVTVAAVEFIVKAIKEFRAQPQESAL